MDKCSHTEHCCALHGCKYNNPDCPVYLGHKPQSFTCEDCHDYEQGYANISQEEFQKRRGEITVIDDVAERAEALAFLEKEKAKKNPSKKLIELLEHRLEALDLVVATRNGDEGFSWILEIIPKSGKQELCVLTSDSKKEAIAECNGIIGQRTDLQRARLFRTRLEKQFRL